MKINRIKPKYTCLIYGEGRTDIDFLSFLTSLEKFKHHTKNWFFKYGNAHGCSPRDVLVKCKSETCSAAFNLVLCFIDLDKLKKDFPQEWELKKERIESDYSNFKVIWQINNLEDELKKVLGISRAGKYKLQKLAQKNIIQFVNSEFYKKILEVIKNCEKELENRIEK